MSVTGYDSDASEAKLGFFDRSINRSTAHVKRHGRQTKHVLGNIRDCTGQGQDQPYAVILSANRHEAATR